MKTLTISNEKGGVGKTCTAINLMACLNGKGYKVLLVDTDPQRNASDTLRASVEDTATLYDILIDDFPAEETIQHTKFGDIIPGDPALKAAPKLMTGIADFQRLSKSLEEISHLYDFCIIDTQPTNNILTQSSLIAADEVIVPVNAARYSLQGLSDFKQSLDEITQLNPKLKIAGLLLTNVRRNTKIANEIQEILPEIADSIGTIAFKTFIRQSVAVEKSARERVPLICYDPNDGASKDYEAFTDEYISSI